MPEDTATPPISWTRRVGWLVLIWVLSVLALGAVSIVIRFLMTAAGLRL